MSNQIIHNQVDLILFEEGKFSVLNWLLREGYLDYNDYQKWRNGENHYLADNFKAAIPMIIFDLVIAQYRRSGTASSCSTNPRNVGQQKDVARPD